MATKKPPLESTLLQLAPLPVERHAVLDGATPLYQQIKKLMIQSLGQIEWRPGEPIPSEFELAARYQVSQGTVRKAIEELAAENLVVRKQGKGTFVATHHESGTQFRFLRLWPDQGATRLPENRVLECTRQRAVSEIARQLGLKAGDAVMHIRRILSFDGIPTVLDDIWLPAHLFKGMTLERLQRYKGTMYGLLESEFGVHMLRAQEKIRAVAADTETALLLKVAPQTALLSVERLTVTYGDQPVEVRRGLYLTSRHFYRNELG